MQRNQQLGTIRPYLLTLQHHLKLLSLQQRPSQRLALTPHFRPHMAPLHQEHTPHSLKTRQQGLAEHLPPLFLPLSLKRPNPVALASSSETTGSIGIKPSKTHCLCNGFIIQTVAVHLMPHPRPLHPEKFGEKIPLHFIACSRS